MTTLEMRRLIGETITTGELNGHLFTAFEREFIPEDLPEWFAVAAMKQAYLADQPLTVENVFSYADKLAIESELRLAFHLSPTYLVGCCTLYRLEVEKANDTATNDD